MLPSAARVMYVDATRDLPGMIKDVQPTPEQEEVYAAIHRASATWDGSDPIRRTDR